LTAQQVLTGICLNCKRLKTLQSTAGPNATTRRLWEKSSEWAETFAREFGIAFDSELWNFDVPGDTRVW
jgi:hypothetical protein